jgi:gliding motility associated protien GldN
MNQIKRAGVIFLLIISNFKLFAQEKASNMNPNSVYPVSEEHKLYKMTVWRRLDFREKQNEPFFSVGAEISSIIVDAVKDGRLVPYESNDSLNKRMTKEAFMDNLKSQQQDSGQPAGAAGSDWGAAGGSSDWGAAGAAGGAQGAAATPAAPAVQYIFSNQLFLMDMREEVFFDDIRSRMYNDIQSLTIIVPAEASATGVDKPAGTFRFKDLEKIFRSMPDKAIWYNRQNIGQNRNMADAFLLRLFASRVTRISNPMNKEIVDIYQDPKLALYMSQTLEHKLMEYEHDLWEY